MAPDIRVIRKFSILLHEGNVPGLTEEVFTGTKLQAKRRASGMQGALSKEQRDAGWWYEVQEEPPESVPPVPTDVQRGLRRRRRA